MLRTFIGEAGIREPVGAVRGRASVQLSSKTVSVRHWQDVALLWIVDRQQLLPIDEIDRTPQR